LFESLIPIINILADYLTNYLLPVFSQLIEWALPPLIHLIEQLTSGFEWLHIILGPVYQAIKPVLDGLLAIAGIKPGALDKTVTMRVNTAYNSTEARNMASYVFGSAQTPNVSTQVSATVGRGAGAGSASTPAALSELTSSLKKTANLEQEVLKKRLSAFESFNDAVKGLFGQIKDSIMSSFELPKLGNSVNSITRNIGKLLEKTKGFAQNISKLAGLGLNPALLQQVIGAGPMAGSQLAAALVGGGSAFVSQLNSAYGEFGDLAGGIAGTGASSAFNTPTVANTYNIEVNGGVGSGPSIGKAIVDAIKSYERTSGAVWQGA
jgi:hypothetical protein